MDTSQVTIRALESLDEMRPAVELQRVYWGDDLESVVPAHMLFSLAHYVGSEGDAFTIASFLFRFIAGAFFSGYASSGSFNRSGLNYEAGAKTPASQFPPDDLRYKGRNRPSSFFITCGIVVYSISSSGSRCGSKLVR